MKVEINAHDHKLKNIEDTFRAVNALVQEQIVRGEKNDEEIHIIRYEMSAHQKMLKE